jgi:hypothetical protein
MKRSLFSSRCCRLVMSTAVMIAGSGCGGDSTRPDPRPECGLFEDVTISVGPGTTPEFSWTPECGVAALSVDEIEVAPGARRRFWEVSGSQSALHPPVRYGTPPNGSSDMIVVPPAPLEVGHTYRVTLYLQILFEYSTIGSATFTP